MASGQEDEEQADSWGGRASKSARKREAASLQDLGVRLAGLPEREIEELELPENLTTALRDLKRLPTHGAQLRQRQYIGKLMRRIDPEPVLAKLDARKQKHDGEIRQFQKIEGWRDRLLTDPGAVEELLEEFPQADRPEVQRLVAKAAKELAEQRPPSAARELFAFLRQLLS